MSDVLATSEVNDLMPPSVGSAGEGASWQIQDQILRALWMEGKSPQAIGDALQRSVSAIMTRAARLGLPRRNAPGRKRQQPVAEDMKPKTATVFATGAREPRKTAAKVPPPESETIQQPPATAPRICLMCLTTFQSAGRHNRICLSCKNSSEYSSASTLPDIHLPPAS